MAIYEVVTSPGYQFPVGFTFETDALHPSMRQHVKLARGVAVAAENDGGDEVKPLVGPLYVEDEGEAFDLAALEYAERVKPVDEAAKPAAKPAVAKAAKVAKGPATGPGENS